MTGREQDVRKCLEEPDVVRESAKDPNVHLYYVDRKGTLVCVITATSVGEDRIVVTAYLTRNIKEGRELWKK